MNNLLKIIETNSKKTKLQDYQGDSIEQSVMIIFTNRILAI